MIKPQGYHGCCNVLCPHLNTDRSDLGTFAKCKWLKKDLSFYDGWFLQENICYILSWAQSVMDAHQVKGNAP